MCGLSLLESRIKHEMFLFPSCPSHAWLSAALFTKEIVLGVSVEEQEGI